MGPVVRPRRAPHQGRLDGRTAVPPSIGRGGATMECMTVDQTTFGATLRAWRDRLSPAAAGCRCRHGRRAPGCAARSWPSWPGCRSTTSCASSRAGRRTPSAQVVAALARALQLTVAERDHLYRLAGLAPPADGEISDHIPPGVQRVLHRLGDVGGRRVRGRLAADLVEPRLGGAARRPVRDAAGASATSPATRFPVDGGAPRLAQWPVDVARRTTPHAAVVSDLRRATGRFPDNRRLAGLIARADRGQRAVRRAVGRRRRSARTARTTRSSTTRRSGRSRSTATC